jgi:Fe2+ or Zn2+ uptake regulation protein
VPRRESDERTAEELATRGLRATRQRVAILRLLRSARGHPTAAEVHRSVQREQTRVSLKTVYECLDSLVAAGLASCVVEGGGPHRYEGRSEPHYHARCSACGSLEDLAPSSDGHIRTRTALPEGFAVQRIAVTLVGRCARCREDL